MKTYNKPNIIIEDINVEDILAVSVQGALDSWDNLGENNFSTFEDLWN